MRFNLPSRVISVFVKHQRPDLDKNKTIVLHEPFLDTLSKTDYRQLVRDNCPSTFCEVILENGAKFTGNAY